MQHGVGSGSCPFPSSILPSCFTLLSCRSTGAWPSFSVTWVRETGGCPHLHPTKLPSGNSTKERDCTAAPPWSPNAASLVASFLPPQPQSNYQTVLAMGSMGSGIRFHLCVISTLLLSPEKPRTFSQRENNFTIKIFIFQFLTNFSSLIYIAFFLGR